MKIIKDSARHPFDFEQKLYSITRITRVACTDYYTLWFEFVNIKRDIRKNLNNTII